MKSAERPGSALTLRSFRMSRLDLAALRFLGGPNGSNAVLRRALWFYLGKSGDFDREAFERHLRKDILPTASIQDAKALKAELDILDELLEHQGRVPAPGFVEDVLLPPLPPSEPK